MRTLTINGKTIEIRCLTRKQFRDNGLEDLGYGMFGIDMTTAVSMDPKKRKEAVDKFIVTCTNLSNDDLYDMDFTWKDLQAIYKECQKENYGSEDEEKNLKPSGTV